MDGYHESVILKDWETNLHPNETNPSFKKKGLKVIDYFELVGCVFEEELTRTI